jgi:hypothetical protein
MIDNPTRPAWLDNRTVEDWEADPLQDTALDAALAHDDGPATPHILAAIRAGTYR